MSLNDGHFFYHLVYHSQPAKFTNLYALKIFIVYVFSKEEGGGAGGRCILILLPFALESSLFFSYVRLVGEHTVSET